MSHSTAHSAHSPPLSPTHAPPHPTMAPILSDEESPIDPYALLGLTPDAAESEIKSAYRKLSLKCHPDRVRSFPGLP